MNTTDHDPTRDLSFERFVDLPPETIWAAWTQPGSCTARLRTVRRTHRWALSRAGARRSTN